MIAVLIIISQNGSPGTVQFYIRENGGRSLSMQLVGCFLSLILYGILCDQVCQWTYHCPHVLDCSLLTSFKDIYYISFPKDNLASKTVVYLLWLIETAQTVTNIYYTFHTFCYNFGNLAGLDDVHITWFAIPILSGLGAHLFTYICTLNY